MNWFKENPVLTGILLAAILVLGGTGYFAFQSHARYSEMESAYAGSVQALHQLQNRTPFPSEENLSRTKETVDQYRQTLRDFQRTLRQHQSPPPANVTPEIFQDSLNQLVKTITEKAEQEGVKLPQDFYMGFDGYANSLPNAAAAPYLAAQLEQIRRIVEKLIEFRVDLLSLARSPLPVESNPDSTTETRGAIVKDLLDLEIRGEQSRIRLAFNSLLQQPAFLILRLVTFENSQQQAPIRGSSTAESESTTAADLFADIPVEPAGPGSLNVVLGRELVTAKFRLELLTFTGDPGEPASE
jgi:hypothetical protein